MPLWDFATLGVITLPVLAPIAALLQLLFPGLLRDQWKQYRVAITVLLTQSTVFMIHWALVTWWVTQRVWWLSDAMLTAVIVLIALIGVIVAAIMSHRRVRLTQRRLIAYHAGQPRAAARTPRPLSADDESRATVSATATVLAAPQAALDPTLHLPLPEREGSSSPPPNRGIYIPPVPMIHPLAASPADRPPAKVEYIALSIFAALGILWAIYQLLNAASPLDQVASVTIACIIALAHLAYRSQRSRRGPARPIRASTELVFLLALALSAGALGVYVNQAAPENLAVDRIVTDWPTYRGNKHRTGVIDGSAAPKKPRLLWTFTPAERKGRVMIHSTPTVVDGLVYVGALHEIQTFAQGYLYCINASQTRTLTDAGKPAAGRPAAMLEPGALVWKFTAANLAGGPAKPIFCAPTVHAGIVYVGEGYHEDKNCRLFALDAGTGKAQWMVQTTSHTESPPTVVPGRIYFGAGDDGVLCYDMTSFVAGESGPASPPTPRLIWQAKDLHIDGAPCVADGRVFVGTVIGDVHASLVMLALDADTGDQIWRVRSPLPVPGCAAHAGGRVYFGLGNGKLGIDPDQPAGAVWCLDAATGEEKWIYKTGNGVFGCPAIAHGNCYFTCRDGRAYCVDERTGELRWKIDAGAPIVAAPVVTETEVIIVTTTGIVKCLNAKDGSERWSFDELKTSSNDVYASPTLSSGRLYIAAGGKVHCLGD